MKRFLLLLLYIICISNMNAQKFYSKKDVSVSLKGGWVENSWDFLIENGEKIPYSAAPYLRGGKNNFVGPDEICYTYFKNGKFLVLTISEEEGLRLRTGYNAEKICDNFEYIKNFSWYEIDFEHIVYDSTFNRILIPCGIDEDGYHYAICIGFDASSSVESVKSNNDNQPATYYDLEGRIINPDNYKGNIVIKRQGNKSKKYINK